MTAVKCDLCDLTYADNEISDVVNHNMRHNQFKEGIEQIGFQPLGYTERENLKRKGILLFYSDLSDFEKAKGMNMIIKARYDREVSNAIKGDYLWDLPSYFSFFKKEADDLISSTNLGELQCIINFGHGSEYDKSHR